MESKSPTGNSHHIKDRDRNPSKHVNALRSRPPVSANAMFFSNDILINRRNRHSSLNLDQHLAVQSNQSLTSDPGHRSARPQSRSWIELLSSPLGTSQLVADDQRDYIMAMDALRAEGIDATLPIHFQPQTQNSGARPSTNSSRNTEQAIPPVSEQEIRDRELFFREREVFLRERAMFLRERERFLAEKELFHREKEALLRRESALDQSLPVVPPR
jgi:hypothetical protein